MSRRQRTSPSRELRESAATAKRAAFDPLAIAREIVAALADAVVVTGTDRRILTGSRAAGEAASEYRRTELIGQCFAPTLPDDELPRVLGQFQKALAGETGQ